MAYSYLGIQSTAQSLLTKFGQQLTFTRVTKGAFNPNTGTTSDTSATFTKYGCAFDYTDAERADQTIQEGDRRILAEAHDYKVGDKVSLNSEVYRIIAISEIRPAATIVAVNLQVRK